MGLYDYRHLDASGSSGEKWLRQHIVEAAKAVWFIHQKSYVVGSISPTSFVVVDGRPDTETPPDLSPEVLGDVKIFDYNTVEGGTF
jgi:hypothetical protein